MNNEINCDDVCSQEIEAPILDTAVCINDTKMNTDNDDKYNYMFGCKTSECCADFNNTKIITRPKNLKIARELLSNDECGDIDDCVYLLRDLLKLPTSIGRYDSVRSNHLVGMWNIVNTAVDKLNSQIVQEWEFLHRTGKPDLTKLPNELELNVMEYICDEDRFVNMIYAVKYWRKSKGILALKESKIPSTCITALWDKYCKQDFKTNEDVEIWRVKLGYTDVPYIKNRLKKVEKLQMILDWICDDYYDNKITEKWWKRKGEMSKKATPYQLGENYTLEESCKEISLKNWGSYTRAKVTNRFYVIQELICGKEKKNYYLTPKYIPSNSPFVKIVIGL